MRPQEPFKRGPQPRSCAASSMGARPPAPTLPRARRAGTTTYPLLRTGEEHHRVCRGCAPADGEASGGLEPLEAAVSSDPCRRSHGNAKEAA